MARKPYLTFIQLILELQIDVFYSTDREKTSANAGVQNRTVLGDFPEEVLSEPKFRRNWRAKKP